MASCPSVSPRQWTYSKAETPPWGAGSSSHAGVSNPLGALRGARWAAGTACHDFPLHLFFLGSCFKFFSFFSLCIYFIMCILPVTLGHRVSTGDDFAPRKRRPVSGHGLVAATGVGGGSLWRVVGGGQGCCQAPCNAQDGPQRRRSWPKSTVLRPTLWSSQPFKSLCPLLLTSRKKGGASKTGACLLGSYGASELIRKVLMEPT